MAPVSWLVQRDVDEGRGILNFSEWDKTQPDIGEVVEQVQSGEMPPLQYKLIHGGARLSNGGEGSALADGPGSDLPAGSACGHQVRGRLTALD